MSEKEQIINYEELFPENTYESPKIKTNKWPYIIILIIYGIFTLFNVVAEAVSPKYFYVENLVAVLKIESNEHILILDEDEYLSFKDEIDLLNKYQFNFESKNFYVVNKDSSQDLTVLDYELFLNGDEVLWPNNTNLKIIYSDSQLINKYSKDHEYFVDINNYLNYSVLALSNLIIFIILLTPIVILVFADLKDDVIKFLKDKDFAGWNKFAVGILPLFAISIGIGIVTNLLSGLLGFSSDSENQKVIELIFSTNAKFIMIINVVIIAPILEELVFRKSIFSLFKNKKTALIVSSVAFGLIHLITESVGLFSNSFQIMKLVELIVLSIPYISMGVLFSYFYKASEENIVVPVLLHALINTVSVIGILFV